LGDRTAQLTKYRKHWRGFYNLFTHPNLFTHIKATLWLYGQSTAPQPSTHLFILLVHTTVVKQNDSQCSKNMIDAHFNLMLT